MDLKQAIDIIKDPNHINIALMRQAADLLQQECREGYNNHLLNPLLEEAFMMIYRNLYPVSYGSIFVPITPTIGFTHCHFLDPWKFDTIEHNSFWIKFNIVYNQIEDLPAEFFVRDLVDLIHLLHLLAYIKNSYYEKHVLSTLWKNDDRHYNGVFELLDYKLIILWEQVKSEELVCENEQKMNDILERKDCIVLIDDWTKYPSLVRNKPLFRDYLNSWGNEAVKEIWTENVEIPSLQSYLRTHTPILRFGSHKVILRNEFVNVHVTKGLIDAYRQNGYSWRSALEAYQKHLDYYRELKDDFDQVFFVGNQQTTLSEIAFHGYNGGWRESLLQKYAGRILDYSPDTYSDYLPTPVDIIAFLTEYLLQYPSHHVLFCLGLHGERDGSARYAGGNFFREGFETLFGLAEQYHGLQLLIVSCRSGTKAQQLKGNVIMTSSDQVSYGYYMDHFLKHYRVGKTLYQSHLLATLTYQASLLPTSFVDADGKTVILCGIGSQFHQQKDTCPLSPQMMSGGL